MAYTWGIESIGDPAADTVVLQARAVGSRVPSASWAFDWQNAGQRVEVTGPTSRAVLETTRIEGRPVSDLRIIYDLEEHELEREAMTYVTVDTPAGPVPRLETRTVTLAGAWGPATYTTTYHYSENDYGDYGQPNLIEETGDYSRSTEIAYRHDFTSYIRGVSVARTTSESTVNGPSSFSASGTYNSDTGFRETTTRFGVTTAYTNDGHGNVASVTDANGRSSSFTYAWGVRANVQTPEHTTTRTVNEDGTVAVEARSAAVTDYSYDAVGRVTGVATNATNHDDVTTSYDVVNGLWVTTTSTRGLQSTVTTLDGFGRGIATQNSAGVQSRVEYDGAGQMIYRSLPYGGSVAETGTQYTFDALGRPTTAVATSDGPMREFSYDGIAVTMVEWVTPPTENDPGLWRVTVPRQSWAATGHPTNGVRLNGVIDANYTHWAYTYDAAGNVTEISASVDAPWRTFGYDSHNRLTSETHPESGTTVYGYDNVGNLISKQDARGTAGTVTYSYDANDRLRVINAVGTSDDVVMTYDDFDQPVTIANGDVQTTLTYDSAGRMMSRRDVIAGHTLEQQYTYNSLDQVTSVRYPLTGRQVTYVYDTQGRLTAVRTHVGGGAETTLASDFLYRGSGELASVEYGNGQSMSLTYDGRHRPVHLVNGPLDVTYRYDNVGNVRQITDARSGFSSTYDYDTLDRLTSVTGHAATSYTYDATGNRLTGGNLAFTYNDEAHNQWRLSSVSGGLTGSFTYDLIPVPT